MDSYAYQTENQKEQPPKKKGASGHRFWKFVVAVMLASLFFLAGLLTHWFMLDSEMRTLIRVKSRIQDEYYEEVTDKQFYDVIFGAINDEILDDYSGYMTPKEYLENTLIDNGYNQGLGFYNETRTVDGKPQCFVLMVFGNSPAEKAGIREGDAVIGYGDSESEISDGADGQKLGEYLETKAVGEKVYLKLLKENGEIKTVSVAQESYIEDFVSYRTNEQSYTYNGMLVNNAVETNYPLACLDDDTAYIRLTSFMGYAHYEFFGAMARFKQENKKNLVLDLRLNTGGSLDILAEIASVFCKNATEKSPVFAVADYGKDKEDEYFRCPKNRYYEYFDNDSKIYVLADNLSASASECLIGAMVDYGAISMENICLSYRDDEAKTYGKGIMQETRPVRWGLGGALRLTTARVLWPVSKRCIHGVGVLPSDGAKTVEELYGDNEITKALANLTA